MCLITCKKEQRNQEEDNQESEEPEEADVEEKESPWLSYDILRDLLLLENQVPFFVLKELFDSAYQDLLMFKRMTISPFINLSMITLNIFGKITV